MSKSKTKFVLHGGSTTNPWIKNKEFFAEMACSLSEPVKILLVYFANSERKWEELFEDDQKKFSSACPDKELRFILASDERDKLVSQINDAGVVYVRGGETESILRKHFREIENFEDLIAGKVFGGSSAGVNFLATYYYSSSRGRIEKGLGILPIKAFCHYTKSESKNLKELENHGEDLETFAISEAEYRIYNK